MFHCSVFRDGDLGEMSITMQTTDVSMFAAGGIQTTVKEVQFERHVASIISEGFEHIFNKCLLVECLMLANKVVSNYLKRFASRFLVP